MLRYKITFYAHLRKLVWIVPHVLFVILMPIYIAHEFGDSEFMSALGISVAIFSLSFVPLSVLHLKYWHLNNSIEVEVASHSIIVCRENIKSIYSFSDIERVLAYVPKASKNIPWFPWQLYGYIKIYTPNEILVLTSLIVPNVYNMALPCREERFSLFCYPRKQ